MSYNNVNTILDRITSCLNSLDSCFIFWKIVLSTLLRIKAFIKCLAFLGSKIHPETLSTNPILCGPSAKHTWDPSVFTDRTKGTSYFLSDSITNRKGHHWLRIFCLKSQVYNDILQH